jgi:hypothetical protein
MTNNLKFTITEETEISSGCGWRRPPHVEGSCEYN